MDRGVGMLIFLVLCGVGGALMLHYLYRWPWWVIGLSAAVVVGSVVATGLYAWRKTGGDNNL